MPNTIKLFRDKLIIDSSLEHRILTGWRGSPRAIPGDTVVLGARLLTLDIRGDFLPGINLILLADMLLATPDAELVKIGTEVTVSIFSRTIGDGKTLQNLKIAVNGEEGKQGIPGKPGIVDYPFVPPFHQRRDPVQGGTGEEGKTGGTLNVHYLNSSMATVELRAHGGRGGKGGNGTTQNSPPAPIGSMRLPCKPGKGGKGGKGGVIKVRYSRDAPIVSISGGNGGDHGDYLIDDTPTIEELIGETGSAGETTLTECHGIHEIWGAIPTIDSHDFKNLWAAYRYEVGVYRFRCFDPQSLILAIEEFHAVLELDQNNAEAKLQLTRILDGQTPSGLSRDLDIAPDYQSLGDLAAPISNVLNAFLAVQVDNITADICMAAQVQLEVARERALVDLNHAQQEVTITGEIVGAANDRIANINQQLEALRNDPFTILDLIMTVGAVGAAIASIVSGVGAIISIPASLVALDETLNAAESLKKLLLESSLDKDLSKLGAGFKGFESVSTGILNMKKVIEDIEAASTGNQTEAGKLLSALAKAKWKLMIAELRSRQATDFAQGLQRHISTLSAEIEAITSFIETDLRTGTLKLLKVARTMTNQVSEGLFIAHRAMEIYLLIKPTIRFDYGYISPDVEHDYLDLHDTAHALARDSYTTATGLQSVYFTWNQVYNWLTIAQWSYDAVRPMITVTIDVDDSIRTAITSGKALGFTLDVDEIPPQIYEVKVNEVRVELIGAATSGTAMFWVLHTGHWWMERRRMEETAAEEIVEFQLFPRREICNCTANDSGLFGKIPMSPPAGSEPGPPFSFWGRGVSAEWFIYFEPDGSSLLNVVNLSKLKITLLGIGFSPRPTSLPATWSFVMTPNRMLQFKPHISWRRPL